MFLVVFALWLSKKAFMGKSKLALQTADQAIEQATGTGQAQVAATPEPAPVATAMPAVDPNAAPASAPVASASPTPSPTASLGAPTPGSMGEQILKIRNNQGHHNDQIEKAGE